MIARGVERGGIIQRILKTAAEKGISVTEVERAWLDKEGEAKIHQGIVAFAEPLKYWSVEDVLEQAKSKGEDPFIIILDQVEDPQNLGAILRSAEAAGAHGVVVSKKGVGLSPAAVKASSGAAEYIKVSRVANLSKVIDLLKKKGIWIAGADAGAEKVYYQANLKGPLAIVIGSEGYGIRRLVKEKCDFLVRIPMRGKIGSLNASVAAALLVYEKVRQEASSSRST